MAEKAIWDEWARKNGKHLALTNKEEWTDEEFNERGRQDISQYVIPFLEERGVNQSRRESMIALDIGCGPGRLTRALSEVFKQAIGVDISSEMVSQARAMNPTLTFKCCESRQLQFVDEYFDFVFSFLTFQHFPSKKYTIDTFKEVYRVLKPGGYALIQLRAIPGRRRLPFVWHSFNRLWFGLAKTKGIPLPVIGYAGAFNSHYGPAFKGPELEKILRTLGFRQVSAQIEIGAPRRIWVCLEK